MVFVRVQGNEGGGPLVTSAQETLLFLMRKPLINKLQIPRNCGAFCSSEIRVAGNGCTKPATEYCYGVVCKSLHTNRKCECISRSESSIIICTSNNFSRCRHVATFQLTFASYEQIFRSVCGNVRAKNDFFFEVQIHYSVSGSV